MKLSKAIEGFTIGRTDLSPNTLRSYTYYLNLWLSWRGDDPQLDTLKRNDVEKFLGYINTQYRAKHGGPLSQSGRHYCWAALRSFWAWCEETMGVENISRKIPAPKIPDVHVASFTREEIEALLDACQYTKRADTKTRRSFRMQRPEALRDTALLLFLLGTGVRIGELCRLKYGHVNLKEKSAEIHPYLSGHKSRARVVWMGKRAAAVLWKYIAAREEDGEIMDADAPLFASSSGRGNRPMKPRGVQAVLSHIGERAKVKNVHAHRFRHTFAIQYLRNGGDPWTLQRLLGHSSSEMTARYLAMSKQDDKNTHAAASPVDRWRV
ncbi:MAG: tyrosine-type recombinase/integrase [Anaerolineae bacterium]|nr:tyrosine-type recombinase/integrase [Anaerolineae bacterium]